ncbi:MAG: sodium/solute symporter [Planctomycetes bacterium]|nr:sodium/solute symporter [Planctomycetota bacterium]
MHLAGIDIAIILLYMAGMLVMGVTLARFVRSGKDYFLAGKRLPWWAIGMSLVVTDISAMDMIGLAGGAYAAGIVLANFDWIGCIPAMLIGAFIFIPYFWRSEIYTIPEYLGRRYNEGVRATVASFWIIFSTLNIGLLLYVAAMMFENLVPAPPQVSEALGAIAPSFGPEQTAIQNGGTLFWILVTATIVGAYTCTGGLAAVVITDVAQFIIMMIGAAAILVFGLWEAGGIGGLVERVEALGKTDHFKLVLGLETNSTFAWPAVLFGLALVLSPAYWIGNQAIVQRALGARSEYEAKAGIVWGSLLKVLVPVVMVFPGIIALALFPALEKGDEAMPTLLRTLLPSGLRGLVFAAFLAALMSSVDSYLNSAATLWTKEIWARIFGAGRDDRRDLIVGRAMTVILIAIGVATAPLPAKFESIYNYFQTLLSTFQGPAFAIILLGMLWPRATGPGALAGLVAGLALSVPLNYIVPLKTAVFETEDPFLYIAWWSFFVSFAVTIAVSLATRPKAPEALAGLVYSRKGRGT